MATTSPPKYLASTALLNMTADRLVYEELMTRIKHLERVVRQKDEQNRRLEEEMGKMKLHLLRTKREP